MNARSVMRRLVTVAVAAVVAVGMTVGLSACQNDEELIKSSTKDVLDAFKNPTEENLKPYMGDVDQSDLDEMERYGIDPYELMGHVFKHFDYEIKDVKVEGDKATVSLSVTNASVKDAADEAIKEIEAEAQQDPDSLSQYQSDQKAFMQYYINKVYDALDKATDTTTTDATLTFHKENNEWEVDEDSLDEFLSAALGGIEESDLS